MSKNKEVKQLNKWLHNRSVLIKKLEEQLSELKEKHDNLDKINDILWEFIWEKDYDNIQSRLEEEGL